MISDREAMEHLRSSFANRGALIEHDPFPLWMQLVASYDNQQRALEAAEARAADLLEALRERTGACVACHGVGYSKTLDRGFGRAYGEGPCPHCAPARAAIARAEAA